MAFISGVSDSLSSTWLITSCIVSYLLTAALYRFTFNKLRHVPGPPHTRVTNLALKSATITGQRMYYIDALHKRYGLIVRVAPDVVSINSVPAIRTVYAALAVNPLPKLSKGGVFNLTDPKEAVQRRRLLLRPFSNSSIHTNWEGVTRSYVELAVAQIQGEVQTKGTADVLRWWTLMASDIAAHLMFGERLHQLEAGVYNDFIELVKKVATSITIGYELPWVQAVAVWLPIKTTYKELDVFVAYGHRAVQNARAGGTKANLFTDILSKAGDTEKDLLSEIDVVFDASNALLAGTDTTSVTLTYLIWSVLKHPEAQAKLEAELAALPEGWHDADLEKLPWMSAVIEETLRLYCAAASTLLRRVPEGGAVLDGFALPAGTNVAAQAYSAQRRADVWENPLKWDPTRFMRELTADQKTTFAPFGRGARTCVGLHVAKMSLRFGLALFFLHGVKDPNSRLRLSPSLTDEQMKPLDFFVCPPVGRKCEVVLEG